MDEIKLYENKQIRSVWDEEKEEWYFSVVDVVGVLTEQESARGSSTYWAVLKRRLKEEGNELLTICKQLKMKAADGKMRLTDVADMQGIFRIIQSKGKEDEAFSFFRIPKLLFTDEAFRVLSSDAKVLYGNFLGYLGLFKKMSSPVFV